jgi:hypothetical protein
LISLIIVGFVISRYFGLLKLTINCIQSTWLAKNNIEFPQAPNTLATALRTFPQTPNTPAAALRMFPKAASTLASNIQHQTYLNQLPSTRDLYTHHAG